MSVPKEVKMKIFKNKTFWEIIVSIPILLISLAFGVLEVIALLKYVFS